MAAIATSVALAVALVLFQPWRIFVDERADDPPPVDVVLEATPSEPASATPTPASPRATPPAKRAEPKTIRPRTLLAGRLISHEHQTSGKVAVIELADGRRILRLEDLSTSSGPDLRVWLSAGKVVDGRDGWFVFGKHPHVELGKLKANRGNQNYVIPAGTDLRELRSATIWCKRFQVSFGAAALS